MCLGDPCQLSCEVLGRGSIVGVNEELCVVCICSKAIGCV